MSEAIDNAAVVCYGVSAACERPNLQCSVHELHLVTPRTPNQICSVVCTDKESSNCRLECQYAHQTGVDMIPMMYVFGLGCHLCVDALKLRIIQRLAAGWSSTISHEDGWYVDLKRVASSSCKCACSAAYSDMSHNVQGIILGSRLW